jgi:hypothetical protein
MSLNTFAVGQRLTATLLQNASDTLEAYIPKTYIKSTATARASTTTYTIDPDLQNIPLAIGAYEVELLGFVTFGSTAASLKTHWVFTGTWAGSNGPDRVCTGPNSTAAANAATAANFRSSQAAGQDAIYNSGDAVIFSSFREISRNVQVTAAGTLSLYWAQASSAAVNVTVQGGTAFNVRKLLT